MNELKICFNPNTNLWELIEITSGEVLDTDKAMSELEEAYPKALIILPRGN